MWRGNRTVRRALRTGIPARPETSLVTIDPQAQAVLDAIAKAGRDEPQPKSDADRLARARRDAAGLARFSGEPVCVASVTDVEATGPDGAPLPIRLYRPARGEDLPVLLWCHGGGAIAGSVETHDPALRALADSTGWAIAAVEYRLAPEHPFPAQHEDCMAALGFLAADGERLGLDAARLVVGGDSIGGLYATTLARLARDAGGPALLGQVILYPNTDLRLDRDWPSLAENEGNVMTRDSLAFEISSTVPDAATRASPLASPLLCDDLAGLPPALLVTCGLDPLRDEGIAYGDKLAATGVGVEHRHHPRMIHAFLQMGGWIADTNRLQGEIAEFLSRVGVVRPA